jgi:hypothetical protein
MTVWQQGADFGQDALILRGAAIGHDLRHRGEDRSQGDAALARLKAQRVDLVIGVRILPKSGD